MNKRHTLLAFGSACQRCGYARSLAALQFHHVDDSEKREWSKHTGRVSLAEVAAHPDRFLLLCANCHFEEHERLDAERATTTTCRRCGKAFRVSPYLVTSGRKRYCSRACQHGWKPDGSHTLEGRFWHYVTKGPGCWEWTGTAIRGNPVISRANPAGGWHQTTAARLSYELHHGPIPDGRRVQRTCRNSHCVNPAHLFVVSR